VSNKSVTSVAASQASEGKSLSELFEEMKNGCPHARNRIIEANMGLVGKVSRKYIRTSMMYSDIFQEGCKGLIRAVEKFKPELGFAFSTYASQWISSFIENELGRQVNLVNVPERTRKLSRKLNKRANELVQSGTPENEVASKIAAELDVDREKVSRILAVQAAEMQLKTPKSDAGGELFVQDTLAGDDNVEESVMLADQIDKIRGFISKLPKQRREAVEFYHGLRGVECESFADVSREMGVSRQRVNVLYKEGLEDVRRMMASGQRAANESVTFL